MENNENEKQKGMVIKPELLHDYLQEKMMSARQFAEDVEISEVEVEKLLNGEIVGEQTATMFINFFGADKSQAFIDWDAIGIKNPLADETKNLKEEDN